jgi:hypothetical protein
MKRTPGGHIPGDVIPTTDKGCPGPASGTWEAIDIRRRTVNPHSRNFLSPLPTSKSALGRYRLAGHAKPVWQPSGLLGRLEELHTRLAEKDKI